MHLPLGVSSTIFYMSKNAQQNRAALHSCLHDKAALKKNRAQALPQITFSAMSFLGSCHTKFAERVNNKICTFFSVLLC